MQEFFNNLGLLPVIIVTIISLWLVLKSADFFVAGASSVALKLGMSMFIVGLTIVAMGTSAPELFINGIAAIKGATDLSIGNIIGSNIADILLGLGIPALILSLKLKSETVWKEIPFSFLGVVMLLIFGLDKIINSTGENILNRSEGLALLGFFIIFIFYTFGLHRREKELGADGVEKSEEYSWVKSILFLIGGIIGLVIGGELVVVSASKVAGFLGISQNLIGLTVVAAGTSLPEIATAVAAAKKKQVDMVVGGIVGTIIFNIFFALGITAVIAPLPFSHDNIVDIVFLIFTTSLLFIAMFFGKKHTLEKSQGVGFIILYILYLFFIVLREIV